MSDLVETLHYEVEQIQNIFRRFQDINVYQMNEQTQQFFLNKIELKKRIVFQIFDRCIDLPI